MRRGNWSIPARAGLAVALWWGSCAVPCRGESLLPLRTETADTLPSAKAEAVLGVGYAYNSRFPFFTGAGALEHQHLVTAPEMALRAGAGGWVEIQASFEMISNEEAATDGESTSNVFGPGDARLFTKVRVLSERERRPGLGLRFGTKLPNANVKNRLGTDQTDFGIEALASKDFGVCSAHANVGLLLLGNPGPMLGAPDRDSHGQDDLLSYSLAVVSPSFSVVDGEPLAVRLGAELIGLANSHYGNDRTSLRLGLQASLGDFTAYGGASCGLVTGSEDVGASIGLIYAFELDRLLALGD